MMMRQMRSGKMTRSIMWQYIGEEPTYLLNILNNPENKDVIQKVKDFDTIYICAHGSSYNAACSVAGFISDMAHVRVYVYTPSNFKHNAKSIHYENKEDLNRVLELLNLVEEE